LAAHETVDRLVAAWTGSLDREELMARCLAEEVPAGPLNAIDDIFADPQFRARDDLVTVLDAELGEVVVPGVIPKLSATPGRITSLGPPLGIGNEAVYSGLLGLDEAELQRLAAQGVI
jgi:crotonobetainyl-CoA:carnitine CoA-transferase CaiB-like acyl-CoA transferase